MFTQNKFYATEFTPLPCHLERNAVQPKGLDKESGFRTRNVDF